MPPASHVVTEETRMKTNACHDCMRRTLELGVFVSVLEKMFLVLLLLDHLSTAIRYPLSCVLRSAIPTQMYMLRRNFVVAFQLKFCDVNDH